MPREEVVRVVRKPNALTDPIARRQMTEQAPLLFEAIRGALGGALHHVFQVGLVLAILAFASGFWLPASLAKPKLETTPEAKRVPASAAECEKLLMAEMTTIDAENEPVAERGD
jgi:hypothetical protein